MSFELIFSDFSYKVHAVRTQNMPVVGGLRAGILPETVPARERKAEKEVNAARRKAIRDLLYRKDA